MDIAIGISIGIILSAIVAGIIWLARRRFKTATEASKGDESTSSERETKRTVRRELLNQFSAAETRDDYVSLQQELVNKQSHLSEEDYNELLNKVKNMIQVIDDNVAAKAAVEPKLEKFRALKEVTDQELLFNELHLINVTDHDVVITYDELDEFGDVSDMEWLDKTYDEVLIVHFRQLLVTARLGTVTDYKKVMKLWEELVDFDSNEGEDREEFVTKHLANEWNEMIVRFKRELDWDDDLFTLDDVGDEIFPVLIRKSREEKDFLSMRLALQYAEDDDDFKEALAESLLRDFRSELSVQYSAIGFRPDEQERII